MNSAYGSRVTDEYVTVERPLLDVRRLHAQLQDAGFPWEFPHYSRVTTSTQDEAKHLHAIGKRPPYSVVTDEQSAGRGRFTRVWQAPAGSSLLLTVALPFPSGTAALPLAVGAAVLRVLHATEPRIRLKWPNDLVVEFAGDVRKLGGIIAEVHGDCVLVGIGINIDMHDDELPTPQAISLRQLGVTTDRETLLAALLRVFAQWEPPSVADYRALCLTIGKSVRVTLTDGSEIEGLATSVTDTGALCVVADDRTIEITTGDVQHVRSL